MNKKQFFILLLLICPFLYQETLQASFLRRCILASALTATAAEIYYAGECTKTLPLQQQTRLAKEVHPYLDATLGMARNTTLFLGNILAHGAQQLKNADDALELHREETIPTLIKRYNPFNKNTAIQDLEKALELESATPVKTEEQTIATPIASDPLTIKNSDTTDSVINSNDNK
jgi:hypothetical protein